MAQVGSTRSSGVSLWQHATRARAVQPTKRPKLHGNRGLRLGIALAELADLSRFGLHHKE